MLQKWLWRRGEQAGCSCTQHSALSLPDESPHGVGKSSSSTCVWNGKRQKGVTQWPQLQDWQMMFDDAALWVLVWVVDSVTVTHRGTSSREVKQLDIKSWRVCQICCGCLLMEGLIIHEPNPAGELAIGLQYQQLIKLEILPAMGKSDVSTWPYTEEASSQPPISAICCFGFLGMDVRFSHPLDFLKNLCFSSPVPVVVPSAKDFYPLQCAKFTEGIFLQ